MSEIKIVDQYCDECEDLNPTEEQQSEDKEPHVCKALNKPVYHLGQHPLIVRHINCPKGSAIKIEINDQHPQKT